MLTQNVLMKWGFRGVQSGLVNKGVFLFAYVVYWLWLQIKIHSCDSLIFEDALKVFSIQFLVACVNWKWEASSKNNENYVSGSVPIILRVGAAGSGYLFACLLSCLGSS